MTDERHEQLLRAILSMLVLIARWLMDSKDADYRTRATWNGLREGIQASEVIVAEKRS